MYFHDKNRKEPLIGMLSARVHRLRDSLDEAEGSKLGSLLESEGQDLIDKYDHTKLKTLVLQLKEHDSGEALLVAKALVTFLEKRCTNFIVDHKYEQAYDVLQKARSFAEVASYDEILPIIDFNLGYLSFSFLEEYDNAISNFSQAINHLKTQKRRKQAKTKFDPRELANSYRWRAYTYLHKGFGEKALKDFQRAIEELEDQPDDSKACAIIADCYGSAHLLVDDAKQAARLRRMAIDFKKKAVENTFDPFWKYMSQARIAQMEGKITDVINWYNQALMSAKTGSEKRLVRALLFLFSGRVAIQQAIANHDVESLIRASEFNQKAYDTYPIIICKNCWHLFSRLKFAFSELEEMSNEQLDDIARHLKSSKESFMRYHATKYSQLTLMLDDLLEMISEFKKIKAEEDLSFRRELTEKIQEKAWSVISTANNALEKTPLSLFTESIAKKIILSTTSMASLPNELKELWPRLGNVSSEMGIDNKALLSILGIIKECALGIEEHKRLGTGFVIGERNDLEPILSANKVGMSLPLETVGESRNEIMRYIDVIDGVTSCFFVDKEGTLLGAAFLDAFRKVAELKPIWSEEYIHLFSLTSHLPVLAIITPRNSKTIKIFRDGKIIFELTYIEKWRKWSLRDIESVMKIVNEALKQREISDGVFLKVFATAQLMSERRVGGSFILGDSETVLRHSETPRITFEVEPNVLSMSNEAIISFAKQENALVVSSDGILKGASVRLCARAPPTKVIFLPDDGTRHKTTIEMTAVADQSIGIVVSENGPISICAAGKRVLPAL